MTINYYRKNVFGQVNKYLASNQEANAYIKALTGKKTINDRDIEALKGLGFDFEEVLPEF